MDHHRLSDLQRFYDLLDRLEARLGGKRTLASAHGRMDWPRRGVYFFFEAGEYRTTSGAGLRVVRVGTHGLKSGSKSTLWGRLSRHQGTIAGKLPGGGNHRGSVFRLHVGNALLNREIWSEEINKTWGVGNSAARAIKDQEYPLEKVVSDHIRRMPFLWVAINDEPGPNSLRAFIEKNAIALLSNFQSGGKKIDPPSVAWLGNNSPNEAVRRSGLWNVNFVADTYGPDFLDQFESLV